VLQDEVTLPPAGTISELCRDFLTLCLQRDPARRPPATALLTHPWVAQAAATDVKGLMKKTMFLQEDRCALTGRCVFLGYKQWHSGGNQVYGQPCVMHACDEQSEGAAGVPMLTAWPHLVTTSLCPQPLLCSFLATLLPAFNCAGWTRSRFTSASHTTTCWAAARGRQDSVSWQHSTWTTRWVDRTWFQLTASIAVHAVSAASSCHGPVGHVSGSCGAVA
jgi:serine/threonine protein kinase